MRKRLAIPTETIGSPVDEWLDLAVLSQVVMTSEDAAAPIEAAIAGEGIGWRASAPGSQLIRLVFDSPQSLRRIHMRFVEHENERTQEFVLRWSADGTSFRDLVRQQWNFSPTGSTEEQEDYEVDLIGLRVLELVITPDISGGEARASLARLRVA